MYGYEWDRRWTWPSCKSLAPQRRSKKERTSSPAHTSLPFPLPHRIFSLILPHQTSPSWNSARRCRKQPPIHSQQRRKYIPRFHCDIGCGFGKGYDFPEILGGMGNGYRGFQVQWWEWRREGDEDGGDGESRVAAGRCYVRVEESRMKMSCNALEGRKDGVTACRMAGWLHHRVLMTRRWEDHNPRMENMSVSSYRTRNAHPCPQSGGFPSYEARYFQISPFGVIFLIGRSFQTSRDSLELHLEQ